MFDIDVAKPGRSAARTLCGQSLGHFFAERADGCGARRCLVGTVVRKDHQRVVLFQKRFSGVAEDLELDDVLVGGRVVVLGALQDHSLVREADSRREREGFLGAGDALSSGYWRGGDAPLNNFQAPGVVNEDEKFNVLHEESESGGEGAFGGEAEGGSGDLHAELGFRAGCVARAEESGDVAGERSELVGVEARRRGDGRAQGVLERVMGEQFFAVHGGEGDRASGVGRPGAGHWKYSGRET